MGLTNDDTRDIAIRCIDALVNSRLICEDGVVEFDVQDVIHAEINKALKITEDDVCPKCNQYPYSETDNNCPVCFDKIK